MNIGRPSWAYCAIDDFCAGRDLRLVLLSLRLECRSSKCVELGSNHSSRLSNVGAQANAQYAEAPAPRNDGRGRALPFREHCVIFLA